MLATISSNSVYRSLVKANDRVGGNLRRNSKKNTLTRRKRRRGRNNKVADEVGDKTKFELGNTRYWRRGINWWKFCEAKFAREIDIVLDERSTVEFRSVEMHRSGNNN